MAVPAAASVHWKGLGIRIASAAVLVPAVLADVWLGRLWFDGFMAVLGLLAAREWVRLACPGDAWQAALHGAAAFVAALGHLFVAPQVSFALILVIWLASLALVRHGGLWPRVGVGYVALPILAMSLLRSDPELGLMVIYWLFAVVWSADTLAFFAGRMIGGPKLAPSISPNKTWAGLGGAVAGAILATLVVVEVTGMRAAGPGLVILAAVLAVTEQAGDLFESAFKRAHGVKDSGRLIPGHGGVLDRVDGLFAAAVVAALAGVLAAGAEQAAQGLLRLVSS